MKPRTKRGEVSPAYDFFLKENAEKKKRTPSVLAGAMPRSAGLGVVLLALGSAWVTWREVTGVDQLEDVRREAKKKLLRKKKPSNISISWRKMWKASWESIVNPLGNMSRSQRGRWPSGRNRGKGKERSWQHFTLLLLDNGHMWHIPTKRGELLYLLMTRTSTPQQVSGSFYPKTTSETTGSWGVPAPPKRSRFFWIKEVSFFKTETSSKEPPKVFFCFLK